MRRLPGSQGRASYALQARVGRRAEENTGARMHADPGHKDGYGEEDGGWPDKGEGGTHGFIATLQMAWNTSAVCPVLTLTAMGTCRDSRRQ